MDPFEVMGLPRQAELADQALQARYDALSKERHPDAGGSAEAFEQLQKAHRILRSPRQRLVALMGGEPERGMIPAGLMEFFPKVASWVEEAEGLIKQHDQATSALTKAMAAAKIPELQGRGQTLFSKIEAMRDAELAQLSGFDQHGVATSQEAMAEVWRALGFIERWLQQVQGVSQQLFQAMLG